MINGLNVRIVRHPDAEKFKTRRLAFLCIGATALLLESPSVYAFCETEARSACAEGGRQCIDNAGTAVSNAVRDCKDSVGKNGNAQLWIATSSFFDGRPQEKQFWRCVATACASASAP